MYAKKPFGIEKGDVVLVSFPYQGVPEDSESQQFSEKAIAKWFLGYGHTFFTRPSALQLERLNAAYIQVQGSLSALNRQRLDLVLGSLNPEPPNANSGGF